MATFDYAAARKQGYTDEEIDKFLATNPGLSVSKPTGTPSKSTASGVGDFVLSLFKPTTDYVKKLASGEAGPLAAARKIEPGGGFKEFHKIPGLLLGQAGEQIKPAANITSFLTPSGGGQLATGALGRSVLPGAISGALQASSQEEVTPQNLVGGAALGGATAGVLDKVLGGVFGKTGRSAAGAVAPPKVPTGPTMASKEAALRGVETNLGIRGSSAARKVQLDKLFRQTEEQLQQLVKGKPVDAKKSQLKKQLMADIADSPQFTDDVAHRREAKSVVKKILSRYRGTADSILSARRSIDVGRGFAKLSGESDAALTPREAARTAAYSSLNDFFKSKVPEAGDLLGLESKMFDLSSAYASGAKERLFLPFGANVPATGWQGLLDSTGRFLQAAGATSKASALPMAKVVTAMSLRQEQIEELPSDEKLKMLKDLNDQVLRPSSSQLTAENMQRVMFADLATTGGKNIPELKSIFEMGSLDEVSKKKEVTRAAAIRILETLKSLYYEGGTLSGGRVGGFASLAGRTAGFNPRLQTYLNARNTSRAGLARALGEVGNLSGPEQENVISLLPTEFSTPEEAEAGFQTLASILGT